jgi:RNA polymerase sigma factor (sigma-70 family)
MEDARAINAVLRGDKERYAELIERHKRTVYAIAWSRLGDRDLADDVAQEAFVKAYQCLRSLRKPDQFGWWIGVIARNISSKIGTSRSREVSATRKYTANLSDGPAMDSANGGPESFWTAFEKLPAAHRESLTVFYIEDKSSTEAAAALGISEAAMRVRLHRARAALRNEYESSLEQSLKSLRPSGQLTSSVMGFLPVAPLGLLNSAALAFVLKLGASASVVLFSAFAYIGLIQFTSQKLAGLNEQKRKLLTLPIAVAIGLVFSLGSMYFAVRFGALAIWRMLAAVMVLSVIQIFLRYKVNPFVNDWRYIVIYVLLPVPMVGMAFFHLPFMWFIGLGAITSFLSFVGFPLAPRRIDYSLFLRSARGLINKAESTSPSSAFAPASEIDLARFAKFLGSRWLAQGYRSTNDGIIIWLASGQLSYFSGFKEFEKSSVFVSFTGQITAKISCVDKLAIARQQPDVHEFDTLTSAVELAVRTALVYFRSGQLDLADECLNVESSMFIRRLSRSWTRTMFYVMAAAMVLAAASVFLLHSGVNPHSFLARFFH